MLIFHEGLPGSGKSYEAIKSRVIPALENKRPICVYIEGFNIPKCAELAGISLDEANSLVTVLDREDVLKWPSIAKPDSLIIIDELQNFYPSGKQAIDPVTTQAVTEHRHKGQDIIGMGQDLRDCHALFKRRVDQKVLFNKLDAVGLSNRYTWQVCKSAGNERFEVVQKGTENYDPKYFGTYKSHVDDATNKDTFKDKRSNILYSKFFRVVLPLAFAFGSVGAWYFYDVMHNGFATEKTKKVVANAQLNLGAKQSLPIPDNAPSVVVSQQKPVDSQKLKESSLPSEAPIDAPQDRVQILSSKYRLRVAGYWEGRGKRNGFIEWRDESGTLRNRFTFDEMQGMGYTVMANQFGTVVTLVNGPIHYIATMWALDSHEGVANQQQIDATRGNSYSTYSGGSQSLDQIPASSNSPISPVSEPSKPSTRLTVKDNLKDHKG